MDERIYRLSDEYSLFKGDFKEKRFHLFHVGEGTIFKLNEVAYDMLSLFDGEKSVQEVVNRLKEMYNISEEKLKTDLYGMMQQWIEKDVLVDSQEEKNKKE